jgi:AraC-like DNA-binding protein
MHHLAAPQPIPIFKFSTLDFPKADRFGIWVSDLISDTKWGDVGEVDFNAEARGAALGPLLLTRRTWINDHRSTSYEFYRTKRRIRLDGQESFRVLLILRGQIDPWSENLQKTKLPGDLFLLDDAQQYESSYQFGDVVSLAIPRDFLPGHTASLHEHTLSSGVGRLLGDHMLSLFRNLSSITEADVPHVVQSTIQLFSAAVAPTPDRLHEASAPIDEALTARVQRYIDEHWTEKDLTPARVCKDIGVSRSKLYQLFERSGGVMREVQRRRLFHAYRVLSDPNRRLLRISEIALNHGFANEKYFYRLFRDEFGHTPGETVEHVGHFNSLQKPAGPMESTHPAGWTLPFGMRQ